MLSLHQSKDLEERARLLIVIASCYPELEVNTDTIISSLTMFDTYWAIKDGHRIVGGFVCDGNEVHIGIIPKYRTKWGRLGYEFLKEMFKDYDSITYYVEPKHEKNMKSVNEHFKADFIKEEDGLKYYKIEGSKWDSLRN